MIKLNLGSGVCAYKGWVNVDKFVSEEDIKSKENKNGFWEDGAEFVQADILKMPFPDEYADVIEMHQVLEHFMYMDVVPALEEIRRVLKTGGEFILDVPCFDGIALEWIEMIMREREFNFERYVAIMQTIVGNQYSHSEGEVHRTLFNPQFMNACLNTAGFYQGEMYVYYRGSKMVKIGELGGTDKPDRVFRNDCLVVKVKK